MQKASNGQTVDLTGACGALAGYDGTGQLNAHGGWLFSVWTGLDNQMQASFWADAFDPNHPLTTPSRLNTTSANPLEPLADAVLNLQAHGIGLDASFGQVQLAPQGPIPIHGCSART